MRLANHISFQKLRKENWKMKKAFSISILFSKLKFKLLIIIIEN